MRMLWMHVDAVAEQDVEVVVDIVVPHGDWGE